MKTRILNLAKMLLGFVLCLMLSFCGNKNAGNSGETADSTDVAGVESLNTDTIAKAEPEKEWADLTAEEKLNKMGKVLFQRLEVMPDDDEMFAGVEDGTEIIFDVKAKKVKLASWFTDITRLDNGSYSFDGDNVTIVFNDKDAGKITIKGRFSKDMKTLNVTKWKYAGIPEDDGVVDLTLKQADKPKELKW